jgi:hypothetical protein
MYTRNIATTMPNTPVTKYAARVPAVISSSISSHRARQMYLLATLWDAI